MKRVLTYGTFDILHEGHINLLKRAKALGDYLVVGISTDEFNAIKGKNSYYNYETRKKMVESLSFVDKVIPEENWHQKVNDIIFNKIDIVVMGDDWANSDKFDYLKEYCQLIFLPRTPNISTTALKQSLGIKFDENGNIINSINTEESIIKLRDMSSLDEIRTLNSIKFNNESNSKVLCKTLKNS